MNVGAAAAAMTGGAPCLPLVTLKPLIVQEKMQLAGSRRLDTRQGADDNSAPFGAGGVRPKPPGR